MLLGTKITLRKPHAKPISVGGALYEEKQY